MHTESHNSHTKKRSKSSTGNKSMKFTGTLDDLKIIIKRIGAEGTWNRFNNNIQDQFTCFDGAVMKFWEATGTLYFDGNEHKWDLKRMVLMALDEKHHNKGAWKTLN